MPSLIGALTAFVALAAGILSHVDPVASIGRACLAYLLGWIATNVWYVFFTVRIEPISADRGSTSETSAEV